jgi:hypothetical protein
MPRMDKISNYRTTVTCTRGLISVVYVETLIVEAKHDTITLDMGGYDTVTTRRKMNQAANQFGLPYRVYRRDFQTYVRSTLDGE